MRRKDIRWTVRRMRQACLYPTMCRIIAGHDGHAGKLYRRHFLDQTGATCRHERGRVWVEAADAAVQLSLDDMLEEQNEAQRGRGTDAEPSTQSERLRGAEAALDAVRLKIR